ncbi:amidohydrolase family protein [Erythrobacter sp. GH1-10]|uniref:amidohydrolase family protein n=1 Tax=Erythrobacter sp. GH1-10 TaxID=3349334 RepID=UPI00387834A3
MRIDVWSQILTPEMATAPWLATLNRWTGRTDPSQTEGVEETIAAMDAAEIDLSLLSAWYGPSGPLISNEIVADQVARAPDRFRGLASADIRRPGDAAREVRTWITEYGFVGVRIVPWLWDLPPNDRRYYPIYAACAELGVPLCTQIGHTGPLLRSETGRPIPYLEDVLLEFPDLKIVGGHLGFPWIDELVSLSIKFPNFYVDTSAYVARRFPPAFVDFMKGIGRGRVMFGTNWPMLAPADCLADLASLGLSETEENAFLGGTARKVFGL